MLIDEKCKIGDTNVRLVQNKDRQSRVSAVLEVDGPDPVAIVEGLKRTLKHISPGNNILIESFDKSPRFIVTNQYVMMHGKAVYREDDEKQMLHVITVCLDVMAKRLNEVAAAAKADVSAQSPSDSGAKKEWAARQKAEVCKDEPPTGWGLS
ncbi:hypothetical protein B7486_02000 [cyanobacterium TDX16]|nr:hypothetical protein B7486_02000 [cyanobacterium TDX16]